MINPSSLTLLHYVYHLTMIWRIRSTLIIAVRCLLTVAIVFSSIAFICTHLLSVATAQLFAHTHLSTSTKLAEFTILPSSKEFSNDIITKKWLLRPLSFSRNLDQKSGKFNQEDSKSLDNNPPIVPATRKRPYSTALSIIVFRRF